jgi:steroid delta-isomerase-like uncharacterized protein
MLNFGNASRGVNKKEVETMSAKENKAIIRNLVNEMNSRNLLWDVWGEEVVIHQDDPTVAGPAFGKPELRRMIEELLVAFPDLHEEVVALIAEEDMVVGLYTETATMEGAFSGLKATGRRYQIPAVEIYRLADGKIVEAWFVRNFASMFQQLGLA